MKQLEFRVWDGKKYHKPIALKSESNHYLQFGEDGFWLYGGDGKLITSTTKKGICEQYTGFPDKFCRNIYEAD